jgi:signal transduction histidine kinase
MPGVMLDRLSLRPTDLDAAIRAEMQMMAKGAHGRVIFALVLAMTSLVWLPALVAAAYFAIALIWEFYGRSWIASSAADAFRADRPGLRRFYRGAVFAVACFHSAVPLSGLLAHELIGWYTAIVAFCWATIVGVTYFSNDKWLLAACTLPSFAVASAAPLVFGVSLEMAAAVTLLHALFVVGAIQSAVHRAELVESIAREGEARSRAETANLEKSRFIANVSHELRTPLNAIIGYGELLHEAASDGAASAQNQTDLEQLLRASRTLMTLVNELLDISKLEAGNLTLDEGWFDPAEAYAAAVEKARPLAHAAGVQLDIEIATDLGEAVGDEYRTSQCVFNLLSNAIGAAQADAVVIRARRQNERGRDWHVVEVSNNGAGLRATEVQNLFDPFVEAKASDWSDGARVGLAITRRVARLLGGDVTVSSAPGAGATFTLRLPADVRRSEAVLRRTA